ncbi:MAG TPA: tryptophan--tRNA ligase, partial [Dongiaceae bacterium]|nr:tryptophan--tRNA ligase [Dongiaceae bacterium]
LSDRQLADVVGSFEGKEFSAFKKELTDLAVAVLGPIGSEMKRLLAHPGEIDAVLSDGTARANAIAEPILRQAEEIVGFLHA